MPLLTSNVMFTTKTLLVIGIIVSLVAVSTYIKLPLPEGINENNTIISNIDNCEIKSHGDGRYGKSFLFVGITLKSNNAPYLRWEADKTKKNKIELMCKMKQLVKISYKAQRLLIRPKVTYWVQNLEVK